MPPGALARRRGVGRRRPDRGRTVGSADAGRVSDADPRPALVPRYFVASFADVHAEASPLRVPRSSSDVPSGWPFARSR